MERAARVGRISPYERVFGGEGAAERGLGAILAEADQLGRPLSRRDQFAGAEQVARLLREFVPEMTEPAAVDRYLEILYHCYNFWRFGLHSYAFEESVVRSLIESPPDLTVWPARAAHASFYLELPYNLFWAAVLEDHPPEPVEGMFVRLQPEEPAGQAEVLLVLGMRADRPGFSVAELTADLSRQDVAEDSDAFVSDIPGADLAGLYSLRRPSEVLVLLLRALWYIDTYPMSIEHVRDIRTDDAESSGRSENTSLDYYRVGNVERSRG
jgi:hypothetical protein